MKRSLAFRPLTAAAVRQAAVALMEVHGTTTTLEVKNRLRSQGFWAVQDDVSRWMQQLADDEGWCVACGLRFRLYSLPVYPAEAAGPIWLGFSLN